MCVSEWVDDDEDDDDDEVSVTVVDEATRSWGATSAMWLSEKP